MTAKDAKEIWEIFYSLIAMVGWIVILIAIAMGRIEITICN